VQWIVVRLSATMSVEDVAMYTDVGQRTVKNILVHFRQTGEVIVRKSTRPPSLHQSLCSYDIDVCHFLFLCSFLLTLCTARTNAIRHAISPRVVCASLLPSSSAPWPPPALTTSALRKVAEIDYPKIGDWLQYCDQKACAFWRKFQCA
jgi:hypothetical protein